MPTCQKSCLRLALVSLREESRDTDYIDTDSSDDSDTDCIDTDYSDDSDTDNSDDDCIDTDNSDDSDTDCIDTDYSDDSDTDNSDDDCIDTDYSDDSDNDCIDTDCDFVSSFSITFHRILSQLPSIHFLLNSLPISLLHSQSLSHFHSFTIH